MQRWIRRATLQDLPALLRIERACFDDAWNEQSLAAELAAGDHHRAWLCEEQWPGHEAAVVGSLLAWRLYEQCEINRVATLPALRGQGIGRLLVAACLEQCAAEGATQALLEVRADNDAAISLYRACHFQPTGRRKRYYRDGGDALVMTRQLEAPGPGQGKVG